MGIEGIEGPPARGRAGRMKRFPVALALLFWAFAGAAEAQEGRFNINSFRPSGAPQDLVMVTQSRAMEKWSPVVGAYFSFALDPLKLIRRENGDTAISVIGNRYELDVMVA